MENLIAELETRLENVEHNAAIHEAEGNTEQARLDRRNASAYRAALAVLGLV